jgi:GWxTD domain-containing protein
MSEKRYILWSAFAILILAFLISPIFAQDKNNSGLDPNKKPKKMQGESSAADAFKKWVDEDVKYIITKEEKDTINKLKTNEERENFIEDFWRRRDPNPDTEENEYREEYYERIAYANEHFTSGIPGWRTDRGRVYISRGKPDSIESHPSGGSYDRPSYEGGGSTTTYPFETWFYRHLDDVGDGIEIEFVDPTGTGEYRIARDADEKDALAKVRGTTIDNQQIDRTSFQRQQDLPFEKLRVTIALETPPRVQFKDLQIRLDSNQTVLLNENTIDFNLRVDFFRQSDNRVMTAFTIQANNKELTFKDVNGFQTAQMNIFGKVTAVSGRRSGIFEDSVSTTATTADLAEAKNRQSIYQRAVTLQPGYYKIDVIIRDVATGKVGVVKQGFSVPKYETEKLATSTLILASRLYQTTEKDIGASFVIGDKKVVPNLSGSYKQGQEVGIYLQVYNAGIDQTTLRPAIDVEYILLKDGREILKQKENWEGLSDSGQRLTLAKLIPTDQLAAGNYEIKIKIKDHVTGQFLEPTQKFSIIR